MEEIIDSVVFRTDIFPKLAHKDIYVLSLTCKKFNNCFGKFLEESILNKINEELREVFGDKMVGFKKLLSESNAVIAGSFILQCMLDEYWEGSDIDIFIPVMGNYPDNNVWMDKEGNTGYVPGLSDSKNYSFDNLAYPIPYTSIENFLYKENVFENAIDQTPRYRSLSIMEYEIICVRTYESKKYNIQTIHVKADKTTNRINDFIHTTFDFDICKNTYSIENDIEKINTHDENNIFNKILHYDPKNVFYTDSYDFDIEDYFGYNNEQIVNHDIDHIDPHNSIRSSNRRLNKYQSRGFKLIKKNEKTINYSCILF